MPDDSEPAPAKVNLALHVTGRRPDGYHLLDSLAVFPAVGDELRATADSTLSLDVTGPFGAALSTEPDNLVLRAARLLAEASNIRTGARLTLVKNLPVASGIGGGSADAAAALRLLQRVWNVAPGPAVLHAIATRLGADVPVCLAARPARMLGIGDHLARIPRLPSGGILLVNPGVAVSTPEVFRTRAPDFSASLDLPEAWPRMASLAHDLARWRNDLQVPAIAAAPIIAEVLAGLARLPGALLARMSGSGATCFALFETAVAAAEAAAQIRRPGWWAWGGPITRPHLPDGQSGP